MSQDPIWIDKEALLLLHGESLAEFGGMRLACAMRASSTPPRQVRGRE